VTLAIGKGAVPMARGANDENPLHHAISQGNVGIVDALLAAGADIVDTDDRGRNALHLAASPSPEDRTALTVRHGNRRKEQMATAILRRKGAQVNGRTPASDTALHFAVRTGDRALVSALL
jgi:ankyrin repeat protein